MTVQDTLTVISTIFGQVWWMLTQVEVPGLQISFAAWLLAGMIIFVTIRLISYNFGIGDGGGSSYRSGKPGKRNISKERKNDEK